MKTTQRHGKAAFTLIELMAVITIIVILAGLVVGGLGYVSEKQASSKAKVQIALLSKALEEYKLDMGTYPPTANKTGAFSSPNGTATSATLYNALFFEGWEYAKNPSRTDSNPPKATRIYLPDLDPTSSKQGWVIPQTSGDPKTGQLVSDPWGNPYCYRTAKGVSTNTGTPTNAGTVNPDFDLWSMGKDGSSKPDTPTDRANRDDIKNF